MTDTALRHPVIGDLLEMAWLLVAVLVPLWVNMWGTQPFEPGKAALLRILVWSVAALYVAAALLRGLSFRSGLRGNPLLRPVLAFGLAIIVSTVFAVDRGLSLLGSYERAQGALTVLSYPLLFLVLVASMRGERQMRRLLSAIVATGVPLVALGTAQALGGDPLGLSTDSQSPVYGTLGRSNFLGAYLAMLLPLTATLARLTRGRRNRLLLGGLLAGEAAILILTMSKGAWLAGILGIALFELLVRRPRLSPAWKAGLIAAGIAALAAALLALLLAPRIGGSLAARATIWRAALGLIVQRPLVGYGPEAFGLVFPGVFPPELVYYQGRGLLVDRAHNLLLDWLATTGIAGLSAYLWLLGAFVVRLGRSLANANPASRPLLAGCLAATGANLASNLTGFDVVPTQTLLWLVLGLGIVTVRDVRTPEAEGEPAAAKVPIWRYGAAMGIAALAGWAIVAGGIRPLVAGATAQMMADGAAARDWTRAIDGGEKTVAIWSGEPSYHLLLSWIYLQRAPSSTESPLPALQEAERHAVAGRDLRPRDFRGWAALGELYGTWGNRWDPGKRQAADVAYAQAIALAPHDATLLTRWGMVDMEAGQPAAAEVKFRRAVALDNTDGYAYAHLGDARLAQGLVPQALAAYLSAVRWAPNLGPAHLGAARALWELGESPLAECSLALALQLDPGNGAAWAFVRESGLGARTSSRP